MNMLILLILIVKHGSHARQNFCLSSHRKLWDSQGFPGFLKNFNHYNIFPNKFMLIKGKTIYIKPEVIAVPWLELCNPH